MDTTINHCKYFVQRKKRYCKMTVKSGQDYCGEHQHPVELPNNEDVNNSKIRILCPLDKKHTVYADKLKKHLKICNARRKNIQPYIENNVNSGAIEENPDTVDSYRILSSYTTEQIINVIEKANEIYTKHVQLMNSNSSYELIEKELEKPEYGNKSKKHLKQASSIVGLLNGMQMLRENTCYIEFGAGRGQLSCWIIQATENLNTKALLIERSSPKHKRDNKLAKTTGKIERIRVDINDLVLDKLNIINNAENVVGVTKHLCGDATDLAIRCMMNSSLCKTKLIGTILTFCCHHKCRWKAYTGKEFFKENNLTIDDFYIMCGLSSWATCGTGFSRELRKKMSETLIEEYEKETQYGFKRCERIEIGRKCKNLINWGRLIHLRTNNLDCSLQLYVDDSVTLENVCIVATRKNIIKN